MFEITAADAHKLVKQIEVGATEFTTPFVMPDGNKKNPSVRVCYMAQYPDKQGWVQKGYWFFEDGNVYEEIKPVKVKAPEAVQNVYKDWVKTSLTTPPVFPGKG